MTEEKMRAKSMEIVKEWGIDKFVTELYSACIYAMNNKKKISSIIDCLLIKVWKGRYNFSEAT